MKICEPNNRDLIAIEQFNSNQYCWHAMFDEQKPRFCFYDLSCFHDLDFTGRVITRTIFSLKNLVYMKKKKFLKSFKSRCAWSLQNKTLKSDIFFIYFFPIFIQCFLGFMLFRVQVFQGAGFSGSGSRVRVQVLEVAFQRTPFLQNTSGQLLLQLIKCL